MTPGADDRVDYRDAAMAQNPDPTIPVTTLAGTTRALDDWLTFFDLVLVALPGRPESTAYVPLGLRALRVFRDADCRAAWLVTGNDTAARRVLGRHADEFLVFLDPERQLVKSLGLGALPAFVHLRADTTLVDAAEGWDPPAWDRVAEGIGKAMAWTRPVYPLPGDPPPFPGWAVT